MQPAVTTFGTRATERGRLRLGEGAFWDADRQALWWVDILGQRVFRADATGQHVQAWAMPELVGFALPRADGRVWVGLQSGLHVAELTTETADDVQLDRIDYLDGPPGRVRFNDACLGPGDSLLAGTLDMQGKEPLGAVFHYVPNQPRQTLSTHYVTANGPALSPDGQTLYVVESSGHDGRSKGVYVRSLSGERPAGANHERCLIAWPHESFPDGVSTDATGNLWVGEWGGHTIRQFGPDGSLLQAIDLPARNPTKVAANGSTLYVTTATDGVDEPTLARFPRTGHVLKVELG